MKKCDELLMTHSKAIEEIVDLVSNDNRAFVSQLMLSNLRHFVEHVMLKIYCEDNNLDLNDDWVNIQSAVSYVYTHNQYRLFGNFHKKHLQKSVSHKIQNAQYSETLVLMYLEPLIKIKLFLKKEYQIDAISNLSKYPLNLDNTFYDYYQKIQMVVFDTNALSQCESDYYYIYKKKPIWINGKLFYELTLGPTNDYSDKFDRFLVFTSIDVFDNYAIEAYISNGHIDFFDSKITIKVLIDYKVSVRTYELNNIAKIVNLSKKVTKKQKEFSLMMEYIKNNRVSLDVIAQYEEKEFSGFSYMVKSYAGEETPILNIITKAREIITSNKSGSNVLKYLLCHIKNTTIIPQISTNINPNISFLSLNNGTLVFDETPYAGNLIRSKEPTSYVYDCIDSDKSECQLLAKKIKDISDSTGQLYVKAKSITDSEDLPALIEEFNGLIPSFQQSRAINHFSDNIFINENEINTIRILKCLLRYSHNGIQGYSNQAQQWINKNVSQIKGDEKKLVLKNMFNQTRVFALYGAAGTGKSTTISFMFNILGNVSKLCLAATHPAVENMRRKINDPTVSYYTIRKFITDESIRKDWDVVVIDECSIVSNDAMIRLLDCLSFRALLLSGDIYQLPSIDFGNWFHVIKSILPSYAWSELKEQFRTDSDVLRTLWKKVRGFEEGVYEYLSHNSMTKNKIDNSIFETFDKDEIILCYNYDGLYGINSINRYLQEKNPNEPVFWKQYIFKVGDPVIFSNNKRFDGVIYNNLKGRIENVVKEEDRITFDVAIDASLSELSIRTNQIEYVRSLDDGSGWTVIRFSVYNTKNDDEDIEPDAIHVIPFQLSYAVSIHKSQGLEYNSVKVVIANNVDELITHNVFYTAITRAKKKLMIYWTPETASKVLTSFEPHFDTKDGFILKARMGLK